MNYPLLIKLFNLINRNMIDFIHIIQHIFSIKTKKYHFHLYGSSLGLEDGNLFFAFVPEVELVTIISMPSFSATGLDGIIFPPFFLSASLILAEIGR